MMSPETAPIMMNDLRYTARMLRKSPLFTLAVVLTVALGIGANTAIFSVVNAVMLRPLPYDHPDRLVWIAEKNDTLNLPTFGASVLNYLSWKEQSRTFESMGAFGFATFNLTDSGDPEQLTGGTVTPSLLPLLGIKPVLGRSFADDEDRPGSARVAMIGEGLWKRRFGGDPAIVGRHLTLNGIDTAVVGIAPASLALLSNGDLWMPMTIDPGREIRLNHVILAVARLRPGATLGQAQAEMNVVASQVGQQYPEMKEWGIQLVDFYHFFVNPQLQTALVVLLCAVGCVLLIAAANVANLLLARAASRQKEIAVRTAIGASRARLLRQLLVESLVLSSLGGAAGLLAALWGIDAINAVMPANLLPVPTVGIDVTVLLFALGLTVATGLLFGIAPAWHAAKTDLNEVLKQATRASSGARPRLRNGLAAAELALATILLIGAGLLAQSLLRLQHVSLGFQSDRLLTFQISLPRTKYPLDKSIAFYRALLESLRATPGVRAAGASSGIPFGNGAYTQTPIATIGPSPLPPETAIPTAWRVVTPGFFQAMHIPLLRGRDFVDADAPGHRAVGRHRQPDDGEAVLGRRRSARPHASSSGRSDEAVHRRRRRRRRAAGGAEHGVAGDLLPEHRPDRIDGHRRPDRSAADVAAAGGPPEGARSRSGPADVVGADDGRVGGEQRGAAAAERDPAGGVRGGGDADRRDRDLRRARLLGEPADAGDRPAHGAGRAAAAGAAADRARGNDRRRDRDRRRRRRGAGAQPRAREPGLRRPGPRSADLRRRGGGAGAGGAGRLRHPGAEGVAGRSDGRPAV